MNSTQKQIIEATFTASNEGRIHFGEVVGRLTEAEVESYTVDYRSHQTTYRSINDETVILDMGPSAHNIADAFFGRWDSGSCQSGATRHGHVS